MLTASGDDLTASEDPFKIAMRQIAGVFAQLEKARLVGKLKAARDRKRATGVKVEGRKSHAESNSLWLWSVNCAAGARRVASDHCVTSPQSLRHADI